MLLVLELFLVNLMKKARNMLAYASRNNKAESNYLHMRENALLLYGSSYILGLIFMALISLSILTTSLSNG